MRMILNFVALLSVWSLPVGMLIYVDPAMVRDILIPGVYLPMVVALLAALSYTTYWIKQMRT